jgi:hypothetical protein
VACTDHTIYLTTTIVTGKTEDPEKARKKAAKEAKEAKKSVTKKAAAKAPKNKPPRSKTAAGGKTIFDEDSDD